jgi:hypothetical protein
MTSAESEQPQQPEKDHLAAPRGQAAPEITPTSTRFPNKAGDHADTDDILAAELQAAGIEVVRHSLLRDSSGEVKTEVRGSLHGWQFERAWYYWMCSGPGIDVTTAERLHAAHGRTVRVDGHGGCPSPREWFKGLACGSYHVDDAEGLKALADTIRALVAAPSPDAAPASVGQEPAGYADATALRDIKAGIGPGVATIVSEEDKGEGDIPLYTRPTDVLTKDEIADVLACLAPYHDGSDFEPECPGCTAYRKLSALTRGKKVLL